MIWLTINYVQIYIKIIEDTPGIINPCISSPQASHTSIKYMIVIQTNFKYVHLYHFNKTKIITWSQNFLVPLLLLSLHSLCVIYKLFFFNFGSQQYRLKINKIWKLLLLVVKNVDNAEYGCTNHQRKKNRKAMRIRDTQRLQNYKEVSVISKA